MLKWFILSSIYFSLKVYQTKCVCTQDAFVIFFKLKVNTISLYLTRKKYQFPKQSKRPKRNQNNKMKQQCMRKHELMANKLVLSQGLKMSLCIIVRKLHRLSLISRAAKLILRMKWDSFYFEITFQHIRSSST